MSPTTGNPGNLLMSLRNAELGSRDENYVFAPPDEEDFEKRWLLGSYRNFNFG